jgi:hypothetical protein
MSIPIHLELAGGIALNRKIPSGAAYPSRLVFAKGGAFDISRRHSITAPSVSTPRPATNQKECSPFLSHRRAIVFEHWPQRYSPSSNRVAHRFPGDLRGEKELPWRFR